ncbi:trimethyllysine dioxygenase [Phlyctema vagabunda]|uniref:trimethyllysine dioxygenase n=1 Tax=Phlyctema vagabunda TaxID=108571 RepID=A0ABR4P832_9HELO
MAMRLPMRTYSSSLGLRRSVQSFKVPHHQHRFVSSQSDSYAATTDELLAGLKKRGLVPGTKLKLHNKTAQNSPLFYSYHGIALPWDGLRWRKDAGLMILRYPHLWLRDNCRCPSCVNPETMQRALDTFSIDPQIVAKEVFVEAEGLKVIWPDDHVSLYPWRWLHTQRRMESVPGRDRGNDRYLQKTTLWDASIAESPPSIQYDEIMANDKGVGSWTSKIKQFGFCFVEGCPVSPEKTKELLERISFIRETHYGGFYDFTSDLTMKDTAYTTQALQAHTDTTYFSDPAGLQMFHLLSHTDGDGGESLLVDGFKAAAVLAEENYDHYRTLSKTYVTWHASGNDGINITPQNAYPVISHMGVSKLRESKGVSHDLRPLQIRWNNDDRGTLPLLKTHRPGLWYDAARLWSSILKRSEMEYWVKLVPGRALIFDNWRVLHGRSAFTGKRRMCGGYINRDDFVSRWRNTNFTKEEVMAQIL